MLVAKHLCEHLELIAAFIIVDEDDSEKSNYYPKETSNI